MERQNTETPDLTVHKRYEKGWFGAPRRVAITADLQTAGVLPLGALLDDLARSGVFGLISSLTSAPATVPAELTNMRGRPRESFEHLTDPPPEGEEELCFLRGKLLPQAAETEDESEDIENEEGSLFSVALRTKFIRFNGSRQIVYQLDRHLIPADNSGLYDLPPAELGHTENIEIHELRLGFELFVARFGGIFFGFAPIINTRFYLAASMNNLRLFIDGDQDGGMPRAVLEELRAVSDLLARRGIHKNLFGAITALHGTDSAGSDLV